MTCHAIAGPNTVIPRHLQHRSKLKHFRSASYLSIKCLKSSCEYRAAQFNYIIMICRDDRAVCGGMVAGRFITQMFSVNSNAGGHTVTVRSMLNVRIDSSIDFLVLIRSVVPHPLTVSYRLNFTRVVP